MTALTEGSLVPQADKKICFWKKMMFYPRLSIGFIFPTTERDFRLHPSPFLLKCR